jgi:hypothetical protein
VAAGCRGLFVGRPSWLKRGERLSLWPDVFALYTPGACWGRGHVFPVHSIFGIGISNFQEGRGVEGQYDLAQRSRRSCVTPVTPSTFVSRRDRS